MARVKHYYNKLMNLKIDKLWKVPVFLIVAFGYMYCAYLAVTSDYTSWRVVGLIMILIFCIPLLSNRNDTQLSKANRLRNAAVALLKANNEHAKYLDNKDYSDPEFIESAKRFDQRMKELHQAVKEYDGSI